MLSFGRVFAQELFRKRVLVQEGASVDVAPQLGYLLILVVHIHAWLGARIYSTHGWKKSSQ